MIYKKKTVIGHENVIFKVDLIATKNDLKKSKSWNK